MPDPSPKPKPPNDALADPRPALPDAEIDGQHLPALADAQDFLRLDTTEEELARLERMLTRAEGFTLAFARVNAPTQRAKLVEAIRARVQQKGVEIVEMNLKGAIGDVLTEIKDFLQQHDRTAPDSTAKRAVFVYGLERVIPSSAIYHPALALINLKRENFREAIPSPLVFWIPEYALQAIAEGAPDFWAWRSGVYEFTLPQEHTDALWSSVAPEGGQIALTRLPLDEKKERIHSLSGLLSEYDAREDKDESNILAIRFDLLTRIGDLYRYIGEYEHALDFYHRALALAETSQDKTLLGQSNHGIGMIYQMRGDYDQALEYFQRSLKIAEELDNLNGIAASLHHIGWIHQFRGDDDQALDYYQRTLQIAEELGDRSGITNSLRLIGMNYQDGGDYDQALEYLQRSLKIEEELGHRSNTAKSLHLIGMNYQYRGDYNQALKYLQRSLKTAEELGHRSDISKSLHHIGVIYQNRGDYDQALEYLQRSLKIADELGDRSDIASSLGQMGQLFLQRGQYKDALEHILAALSFITELQSLSASIAANDLKRLRSTWGAEPFDVAWQEATGKAVPDVLKESDATDAEDA